jgi:general secretion pathway protein A
VINPSIGAEELVAALCDELRIGRPEDAGGKAVVDLLNRHLLATHAAGRRTVLIIDEAQLLGPESLEQVRLLTNLETHTEKLLQVVLLGQPELRELLARPGLRQLAQRITARYHLEPLSRDEVHAYIDHRLRLAGADGRLFTAGAKDQVHRASRGIPRLVNSLCDRALLGAYAQGSDRVDGRTARRATTEVLGDAPRSAGRPAWVALALLAMLALGGGLLATMELPSPGIPVPAATAQPDRPRAIEPVSEGPAASSTDAGSVATLSPTTTPAIPAEPASPPIDDGLYTDQARARARLAELWGGQVDGTEADCERLGRAGLACFVGQGSWTALGMLDRPALLTLQPAAESDTVRYAVVAGTDGDRVDLLAPDGSVLSADRERLLASWYGRFELLWQRPEVTLLRPGDSGPAVRWVRERLAAFEGRPDIGDDATTFDPGLQQRVLRFQAAQGLKADGLVGTRTMIQLDLVAGPGPRLAREPG